MFIREWHGLNRSYCSVLQLAILNASSHFVIWLPIQWLGNIQRCLYFEKWGFFFFFFWLNNCTFAQHLLAILWTSNRISLSMWKRNVTVKGKMQVMFFVTYNNTISLALVGLRYGYCFFLKKKKKLSKKWQMILALNKEYLWFQYNVFFWGKHFARANYFYVCQTSLFCLTYSNLETNKQNIYKECGLKL